MTGNGCWFVTYASCQDSGGRREVKAVQLGASQRCLQSKEGLLALCSCIESVLSGALVVVSGKADANLLLQREPLLDTGAIQLRFQSATRLNPKLVRLNRLYRDTQSIHGRYHASKQYNVDTCARYFLFYAVPVVCSQAPFPCTNLSTEPAPPCPSTLHLNLGLLPSR